MSTDHKEQETEAAEKAEDIKKDETSAPEGEAKAEEKAAEDKTEETKADDKKTDETAEAKPEEKAVSPEYAALNDKYLRLCAEYDNFRKRSRKEQDELYAVIKSDTLKKFLPVYDNLERALAQSTADEAYRKGVEMIMTQFEKTIQELGVTEIDSLGEKFDPNKHNAVMHVDDPEKGENEIVQVFQKGFKIGDKVIRFAMVKVAN